MIDSGSTEETLNYDSDDDLDVERDREGTIQIGAELITTSRTCRCTSVFSGLYIYRT